MLGFLVFKDVYFNLGEECRNKILGNMFSIGGVSISDMIIRNKKIIFRLFSNGVFYQYIFVLEVGESKLLYGNKTVDCIMFVYDDKMDELNKFIYQLVRCCDERQVYRLVRLLL